MKYTTEVVVYEFKKPSAGHRVRLGFRSGVTKEFMTDSSGTAKVEHETSGRAEIYVNGAKKQTVDTPGRFFVYL